MNEGDCRVLPSRAPDIKSILEEDRNEQLVEEQEKEKRSCNFIIHGFEEKGENTKDNDKLLIENFLQKFRKIRAQQEPTSQGRNEEQF